MTAPPQHGPVGSPNSTPGEVDDAGPGQSLPASIRGTYRIAGPVPALSAEFSCDMFDAVERSSGQSVTLSPLGDPLDAEQIRRRYDLCTQTWPEHYGVPRVHDAASPETSNPYIAWAVESGENLRAVLERGESLARRRVLEIGRAVAETLAELHRFGHSAGHLTPASIWLGPAGICQILGLGLDSPARDVIGEGQRYRAPEQLREEAQSMAERMLAGDLAERADVWSLGAVLTELLEGRPRLSSRKAGELMRELNEIPWRPPSHLGHELASLLSAMLTVDPVYRDISAEEVAARLDDLLIDQQVTAPRGQARGAATPARRASDDPASDRSPDPPLPIPSTRPEQPKKPADWRQAVRSIQDRRRAFEFEDDTPTWKIWFFPAVGLGLVLLLLWLITTLGTLA